VIFRKIQEGCFGGRESLRLYRQCVEPTDRMVGGRGLEPRTSCL